VIFSGETLPDGLPPQRSIDHGIDTGQEKPVNQSAYPLSVAQPQEQTKQVEELLKRGLIRESTSPWGAQSCLSRSQRQGNGECVSITVL
jgi:hypothetical protein